MSDDDLRARRLAVVREHMDAENRLDFDAVMATFRRPRYELMATGVVHDGEDAVRGYFASSRHAFPDQRNENAALRSADDGVIAEFDLLGTHHRSGKAFRSRMLAMFLFDEGDDRISCERVYFDSASIAAQLSPDDGERRFTRPFPILYTTDVASGLRFYRDLLGFSETYRFPLDAVGDDGVMYVALELDGAKLGIGMPPPHAVGRAVEMFIATPDADAAVEFLAGHGVEVVAPPTDQPWGERNAYVEDPYGNPLHIAAPSGTMSP